MPGTPLADVLPIATDVLELEITPNRPDCLGVYGVAREVHAATGAPLAAAAVGRRPGALAAASPGFAVEVPRPRAVPALHRAPLRGRHDRARRRAWLKARLMAAGQRPINNVVDITNYVMLLTGQPLHAFDVDLVAGGAAHRAPRARRRDDRRRSTTSSARSTPTIVLIDDADGPTSIAGIMGGARSEVGPTTRRAC